jgi:hypothetical protein
MSAHLVIPFTHCPCPQYIPQLAYFSALQLSFCVILKYMQITHCNYPIRPFSVFCYLSCSYNLGFNTWQGSCHFVPLVKWCQQLLPYHAENLSCPLDPALDGEELEFGQDILNKRHYHPMKTIIEREHFSLIQWHGHWFNEKITICNSFAP